MSRIVLGGGYQAISGEQAQIKVQSWNESVECQSNGFGKREREQWAWRQATDAQMQDFNEFFTECVGIPTDQLALELAQAALTQSSRQPYLKHRQELQVPVPGTREIELVLQTLVSTTSRSASKTGSKPALGKRKNVKCSTSRFSSRHLRRDDQNPEPPNPETLKSRMLNLTSSVVPGASEEAIAAEVRALSRGEEARRLAAALSDDLNIEQHSPGLGRILAGHVEAAWALSAALVDLQNEQQRVRTRAFTPSYGSRGFGFVR
jgi:murein DD-endopeptidase MepM/ murein hydrolase activator NlpD